MKLSFKFFKTKKGQSLLLAIILSLSIFVRFWKMEYLPFQSDWDEYAYLFAGQTLIDVGDPTSITTFPDDYYQGTPDFESADLPEMLNFNIRGSYIIVNHWFDHPPLLPLLAGSWVKLFGYSFPSHIPSIIYRLPMLALSALTLYLIFLISKHFFTFKGGIFSLILFGFSPSLIIIQRMIVGENLFIPLMLLTLYFTIKSKPISCSIFTTVLAGLSKVTGLITIPIVGFYLLLKKQYKNLFIYLVSSISLFALIYSLYGLSIDWPQFIKMLQTQSFRLLGWTNPAFLLSHPGFHQEVIMDFSYYLILFLGIIPLFLPSKDKLTQYFFNFSIFGCLLLVWLTSMETAMLGWYKLPLFTFLAISAGKLTKTKFPLIILLVFTIINNYGLIRYTSHPFPEFWPFRFVLAFIFGTIFLLMLLPKLANLLKQSIVIILLTLYIFLSFYIIDNYYYSTCENKACPLPLITFKQLIQSLPYATLLPTPQLPR